MKELIEKQGKHLFRVYLTAMVILFVLIEAAQLTMPLYIACFLKTIPAVLTAMMANLHIHKNGMPGDNRKYLACAVVVLGAADILLCFFAGTVPVLSQVPGFLAFCLLQTLLWLWLGVHTKNCLLHIFTVILMVGAGMIVHKTDLRSMTALVNLGLVLGNLIQGILQHRKLKTRTTHLYLLSAIGITICDYSILFRNVVPEGILTSITTETAWIGYMPFLVLVLLTFYSACDDQ